MNRDELYKLYIQDCWSQRKIAKHFNISQSTIKYYLDKYDLRIKNRKCIVATNIIRNDRSVDRNCTKCGEFKSMSDFYLNENRRGGSWCKKCLNDSVLARQRKNKKLAIEYKGGSCKSCGFNKYDGALEFHHIDPNEKDFEINRMNSRFDDQIKLELDKCILLCANCHRMIHAGIISL